jgi:hypothetical protein
MPAGNKSLSITIIFTTRDHSKFATADRYSESAWIFRILGLTVSDRDQDFRRDRHKYLDANEETAGFGTVQQRGSRPAGGPAREAT